MSCIIYELKLKNSKYYVGKTSNLTNRLLQHRKGLGAAWTKKHRFINVLETHYNCDPYDEDKYTLKLMEKYGIENVRGGSYVTISFTPDEVSSIQKRIRMALDQCVQCGSSTHFIHNCNVKKNGVKEVIKKVEYKEPVDYLCEICMTNDHFMDDCQHF